MEQPIFDDKTLSGVFKDIYENTESKRQQIKHNKASSANQNPRRRNCSRTHHKRFYGGQC
jgi:hypothetical protein